MKNIGDRLSRNKHAVIKITLWCTTAIEPASKIKVLETALCYFPMAHQRPILLVTTAKYQKYDEGFEDKKISMD